MEKLHGKKVVVVEDSSCIRHYLDTVLRSSGCEVFQAEHGREAIEIIANQKIDVLVTDINMPVMDGISMLRSLYRINNNIPIPVVVLSSDINSHREALTKLGVLAFLEKPCSVDALLLSLNRIIS
ncbi:two-component system chemotaxis response regulator CheY [Pseudomonas oryzihabitans]